MENNTNHSRLGLFLWRDGNNKIFARLKVQIFNLLPLAKNNIYQPPGRIAKPASI
jgi:hypothetical protein